ncbi:MAG: SxtJ family membrane protein [Bacteroidia bacterium]
MEHKDKTRIYSTILVIVTGLLVAYLIWGYSPEEDDNIPWLVIIATTLGLVSLISPAVARLIVLGWEKLALALGYVNSRILLSIIFYLILFPLSLMARLFNKDPLQLKKPEKTNFKVRNHTYKPEDLEKMW